MPLDSGTNTDNPTREISPALRDRVKMASITATILVESREWWRDIVKPALLASCEIYMRGTEGDVPSAATRATILGSLSNEYCAVAAQNPQLILRQELLFQDLHFLREAR